MSPGFGLVQAPAYVWPAALSSAAMRGGASSDVQGKNHIILPVMKYFVVK